MKIIFLSTLLIRFTRIKFKKAKGTIGKFLGDNYPVIPIKTNCFSILSPKP